jgi:hypothetical protein
MNDMALTLAAALLVKDGEISIGDIEALPFVESDQEARDIAGRLTRRFDTYIAQRRMRGVAGPSSREEVIILRRPQSFRHGSKARSAEAPSRALVAKNG